MRLDKFLSHTGFGSRKEVKELLKKKICFVNKELIKDGKFNINPEVDEVIVSGEKITYSKFVYYMLNKPKGVISATVDESHRTVIDLIDQKDLVKDLFPVGRLDKDTTGLLLLTNDGKLAHDLLSPKKKVPKIYEALVQGMISENDIALFKEGKIKLDDEFCLPAKLTVIEINEEAETSLVHLTIVEGKFHQVKRMMHFVGKEVLELNRLEMADLTLDKNLKRGQYRPLNEKELKSLGK